MSAAALPLNKQRRAPSRKRGSGARGPSTSPSPHDPDTALRHDAVPVPKLYETIPRERLKKWREAENDRIGIGGFVDGDSEVVALVGGVGKARPEIELIAPARQVE